jgi:hypothetical protein
MAKKVQQPGSPKQKRAITKDAKAERDTAPRSAKKHPTHDDINRENKPGRDQGGRR